MALTQQQLENLDKAYGTKSSSSVSQAEDIEKVGFFQGIQRDYLKRVERAGNIADITRMPGKVGGSQAFPSGILQIAGQGAGSALDVIGRGVSAIIPDIVEKPIIKAISSVIQTDTAQDAIGIYNAFKTKHPEVAANAEAGLNLLVLFGLPKAGKQVGKPISGLGSVLEKGGTKTKLGEAQKFARKLTKPMETKAVKIAEVARTSERGFGPLKRSIVSPTTVEARAQGAVIGIPGVSAKKTYQQNYTIVRDFNTKAAIELETSLRTNNFVFPKKELLSRLNKTRVEIAKTPTIVGDQVKISNKLIAELTRRLNATKATGSDLLRVRKEFDAWVKSQKPRIFDVTTDNAFTITNRKLRNTINEFLNEKSPNVGVRESLRKQTALYDALETIAPKAALEANTAIGRTFQKIMFSLGLKNKLVQQIAALVGIGGLGAASTFAPAAAVIGIGTFLVYQGGKFILNPEIRIRLGELLKQYGKTAGISAAIEARQVINEALKNLPQE